MWVGWYELVVEYLWLGRWEGYASGMGGGTCTLADF